MVLAQSPPTSTWARAPFSRYLKTPAFPVARRDRVRKPDTFKPAISESCNKIPRLTARSFRSVCARWFTTAATASLKSLRALCAESDARSAYVCVEPAPATASTSTRSLRVTAVQGRSPQAVPVDLLLFYDVCAEGLLWEVHGRKMYLEFTRLPEFRDLRPLLHYALEFLGGCAGELWFNNLATAVAEDEWNRGA